MRQSPRRLSADAGVWRGTFVRPAPSDRWPNSLQLRQLIDGESEGAWKTEWDLEIKGVEHSHAIWQEMLHILDQSFSTDKTTNHVKFLHSKS